MRVGRRARAVRTETPSMAREATIDRASERVSASVVGEESTGRRRVMASRDWRARFLRGCPRTWIGWGCRERKRGQETERERERERETETEREGGRAEPVWVGEEQWTLRVVCSVGYRKLAVIVWLISEDVYRVRMRGSDNEGLCGTDGCVPDLGGPGRTARERERWRMFRFPVGPIFRSVGGRKGPLRVRLSFFIYINKKIPPPYFFSFRVPSRIN